MNAAHLVLQLSATLFYFQAEGPVCDWTIRTVAEGAGERVHSTASCPSHLVWEPAARRAWYTLGHDLHERSWEGDGQPVLRAKLPFRTTPDTMAWGSMLRVSAASGKIRVAFLEPVADKDVVKRAGETFFRRKGRLHADQGAANVGMPYFAVVWDLEAGGAWTEITAVPTNWEAGETLGLTVLSDAMTSKPGTYPLDEISVNALRTREWDGARLAVSATRRQDIARRLAAGDDGFGYLDWTAGTGIVFPIVYGDTPHASSPIYCCRDSCATLEKLRGLPESANHRETFSFQFSGDALLVRPEAATGAWVYEACKPDPVLHLKRTSSAHWLPFDAAWLRRPSAP